MSADPEIIAHRVVSGIARAYWIAFGAALVTWPGATLLVVLLGLALRTTVRLLIRFLRWSLELERQHEERLRCSSLDSH